MDIIRKISVNWYEKYANRPIFVIDINKEDYPNSNEFIYDVINMGYSSRYTLYYAEHPSGLVSFYLHDTNDESGYGGREFILRCIDGTLKTVRGPWSSRSGIINRKGLGPTVDIDINIINQCRYGNCHCLVSLIKSYIESNIIAVDTPWGSGRLWISEITHDKETTFEPCIKVNGKIFFKPL